MKGGVGMARHGKSGDGHRNGAVDDRQRLTCNWSLGEATGKICLTRNPFRIRVRIKTTLNPH